MRTVRRLTLVGLACAMGIVALSTAPAFAAPVTEKPTIDSTSASVTPFAAVIEAKVSAGNEATEYKLEYANSEEDLVKNQEVTLVAEGTLPGVSEEQTASGEIGGLAPATTYYYRVLASNQTGATSTLEHFTTEKLQPPVVENETVRALTQTTAEFYGHVDPEFQEARCAGWQYVNQQAFEEHGYTGAQETSCTPKELGNGNGFERDESGPVSVSANTTYHYRALAENASGLTDGPDETFTTPPYPPKALTEGASAVTTTSAMISGSVDPGSTGPNSATTYYFQYGPTTSYGEQLPLAPGTIGEGTTAVEKTASLTGLAPGTTYHYRIVATNDINAVEPLEPQSSYGQDGTFTTTATPPILSGISVGGVTENSATVAATLDPDGLPTRYELQLANIPGLWQLAASGSASTPTPLSLPAESLTPGTTYYYKLTASNADDTESPASAEGAFTTTPAPAGAAPAGLPATIPYQSIAQLDAKEALEDKGLPNLVVTRKLTRAEKLNKALHACHAKKGRKRAGCEAAAHRQYGGTTHRQDGGTKKKRGRKK